MTVAGYRLPKGTAIIFPPIALHRSPRNWVLPNAFLPERFTKQAPQQEPDPRECLFVGG